MALLREIVSRRVALVAGKGGVGRTTVVAALAIAAARLGKRPLLVEVKEPAMPAASPLARLFGMDHLPHHPRSIAPGLDGALLISEAGTELFLRSVLPIAAMATLAMRTPALLRLLHAGPSFFELGLFYHLLHYVRLLDHDGVRPRYDTVFFDMPATGHALALTSLPDILLKIMSRGPIADALRIGQSYMYDPEKAGAYVVTLAEALPVSESLELIEGLRKTRVPVGGVIANKLPQDPFTPEERAAVDAMLSGRRVRGSAEVDRRRRAAASLERIRKSVDVPLLGIDERPEVAGRAVVDAIADRLVLEEGGA